MFRSTIVLGLTILTFSPQLSASQQPAPVSAVTTTPLPTYPDSTDGLKNLLQDIFAAVKSGDAEKTSAYVTILAIPDADTWFAQTFVPAESPQLAAKYRKLQKDAGRILRDPVPLASAFFNNMNRAIGFFVRNAKQFSI